ncbi:MAG TPA: NAD(P)-binding domain-containing protein [Solirubrobacteraceae bacterium]|nr:NAD(P)-binding domain-containing protein [Solirubrobacteraceae bacterium]
MTQLPAVCIIGAGSSGIAGAKVLAERGIAFDCFEKSDEVGGNWAFGNRNGMSAAYRSLHINTSRERMEYSDYPMPKDWPDYCHHSHIRKYFNDYVDHFGFRDRITFETAVEHAARRDDGVWEITLDNGETRRYDALAVANGHHWDPRWPEPAFPGSFDGKQMHAHSYVDQKEFEGCNVVVLGMGNSAMDIAVEVSLVANKTFLAARRGAHIIPNYFMGKPFDQFPVSKHMPVWLRLRIFEFFVRLIHGKPEDYGLPKPDHRLGEAHPTVSNYILARVVHGEITPKPSIAELAGDSVKFADGSVEKADIVVYCTGYKVSFPFFDEDFISAPDNDLPLYRRVFHPEIDNVFFLALLQPLGATMPLAEAQAKWVAQYLRGEYALPSRAEMLADIEDERKRMFKRYVKSKRHTMQIDFDDYMWELPKELRRGADRARERGFSLPIPARAHAGEPEAAAA